MKRYWRADIDKVSGYTPGEQPKESDVIKLNTNENPYPPAEGVQEIVRTLSPTFLQKYPDPTCEALREIAAEKWGIPSDCILCGNGSDDILTIGVRTFVEKGGALAFPAPTYSLYEVLAHIQGARAVPIPLDEGFVLPQECVGAAEEASLLFLVRPNAPTGNVFSKTVIENICSRFNGIVWVDEAYVDFSQNDCLDLLNNHDNVVISRTLSKSYSLAGVRLGFAIAASEIIEQMTKVKDSYNVNALTQKIGEAALADQEHKNRNCGCICETREWTTKELEKLGFKVIPSEANFIFAEPPTSAEWFFQQLKERRILVRYFPGERTGGFVRITMGTDDEMGVFLKVTQELLA